VDEMTRFDAIVLGAGPAGCACATLLARRSHRVALVRPTIPPAGALAQSVPPSADRILQELGFLDAIDRGRFHRNLGNSVWWAGEPPHVESFAAARVGFHADRASVETVLVAEAERVGVSVLDDASARAASEDATGWTVRCEGSGGQAHFLAAPWVIDATGRHGILARREGRRPDRSTTTLALVRRWRHPEGWPGLESGHTLVESYADGWAWSVPLTDEIRCFTAMIDQRRAGSAPSDVASMLDAELARTLHLGAVLDGAEPLGDAWACPASLYTASSFGRQGLLLAGDAGSFIDPLSSFGVKKALSSGWLAGITAHTALVDPPMAATAVDFFDAREREVYARYRRASVPFFAAAAERYGTSYWLARAESARRAGGDDAGGAGAAGTGPHVPGDGDADPDRWIDQVPEAEVRSAFEEIRTRGRLVARTGTSLRVFERPGIEGHRIVLQNHLGSDTLPDGMRWVRGVDLTRLVQVAPRYEEVPDGWTAYNALSAPVSLPDYLTALATAFAAGFLEHGA
jgi:halogenation protein CepH